MSSKLTHFFRILLIFFASLQSPECEPHSKLDFYSLFCRLIRKKTPVSPEFEPEKFLTIFFASLKSLEFKSH